MLHHSDRVPGSILNKVAACVEFVRSHRDTRGFSPGSPVSSHNPKTYRFVGYLAGYNCKLALVCVELCKCVRIAGRCGLGEPGGPVFTLYLN